MNSKAFILILSLLCVTAFGSVQAQDSVKTAKKIMGWIHLYNVSGPFFS